MFQNSNFIGNCFFAGALASATLLPVSAAQAAAESVVYSFCSQGGAICTDGSIPAAGLISVGGTLYGTTDFGGASQCDGDYGCGTVFDLKPATGAEAVLHSFDQNGTDGSSPVAGLISVGGSLYGTTALGGAFHGGTVFKVSPRIGSETVVHSFQINGTDGYSPYAGLINVGGTLYGTTAYGVAKNCNSEITCGTVFKVNPATGAETVVYSFCAKRHCRDGALPEAGLIDVSGALYGTTKFGGMHCRGDGCGVLFRVDPATGAETVVYSFQGTGTDGYSPNSGLINVGGILYGTTEFGGANGRYGTVFKFDPTTGAETVVYSFQSNGADDGYFPSGNLINVGGTLYGTTPNGGANQCAGGNGCGTVFKVTLP